MKNENNTERIINEIPIDLNADLRPQYLQLRNSINIGNYIKYIREDAFKGFFQVGISVQININSEFIPFFLIKHDNKNTEENANKSAQTLVDSIEYNYTQFYQDTANIIRTIDDSHIAESPLSEFLFDCEEQRGSYTITKFCVDVEDTNTATTEIKDTNILNDINKLLKQNKNNFIQKIAELYNTSDNRMVHNLYLNIVAFDQDSQSLNKLTHIIIISENKAEAKGFLSRYVRKCRNLVSLIRTKYVNDLLKKVHYESIKSAKAAIMSRNMSHNLGSHVMAYLKQHLGSVTAMLQDNILTRLCSCDGKYDKLLDYLEETVSDFNNNVDTSDNIPPLDKVGSRLALPFLVGLGQFVSYLQERQDFIATISTDHIPYYATVNFKDCVYDELNPDKRYERHKDRKNQQLDNILLGNIARSEGLGRSTSPTKNNEGKLCDIVLRYKDFDGNPCEKDSPSYNSLEELRRLNVSLPGGIVGRQAIFSIVENVIRNAAKHSDWRNLGKLELTFNKYDLLFDDLPNDDELEGHHSLCEVIDSYYRPAVDINDLYIITLTDNSECTADALKKLRVALDDEYVDSSGLMKGANKGLKEMRISAAWLRAIKDETTCVNPQLKEHENVDYIRQQCLRAPILYARISADEYRRGHLQYIFCLPKPKVLAVVSDYLAEQCRNTQVEGCKFYTEKEFEVENNKSYEFILCDEDSKYECIRPYSSSRTFTFSKAGVGRDIFLSLKEGETLSSLLEHLYKKTFGYKKGDRINVDDKKAYGNLLRLKENEKNTNPPIEELTVVENDAAADRRVSFSINDPLVGGLPLGNYLKRGNVFLSDGKICGQYIYRTHHDSIEQFSKFMDAKITVDFVEGVTGNNSTDRLIRNEEINNAWFYRHLHAMKTNVAVCDERLFSKITGLEETDFTRGNVRLATKENMGEIKQHYMTLSEEKAFIVESFDNPDELNSFVDANFRKELQVTEKYSKGIMAASSVQRRVYVFTFIQDAESSSKYYLIGVSVQEQNQLLNYRDADNHNYDCLCARLAELTWFKEVGLSVNYLPGGEYIEGFFDYITIHQGLLDKLYEAFNIKYIPESKDLLTKQLYEHFCKESVRQIIPVQAKTQEQRYFLSGMMIHSGRSKPGLEDMPQVLPFIQYAALEHAVMDCKFSLVELLDHARYER